MKNNRLIKTWKWGLIFLAAGPLFANAQAVAIRAKKIYTVTHGVIENGMILIRDGKIEDVAAKIEIPWNVAVIDYSQKIIVPGLVEAHIARGYDIPNETNPLTPFVSVLDGLDASHDVFKLALRDGVTTLNVMPGHNTILGGKGAIVKPTGLVVEDMLVVSESGMKISMAGTIVQSRMGVAAQLRRYFNETKEYMEKESSEKKEERMVSTPLAFRSPEYVKYESVADLLRGRYTAFVYCQSPSDVLQAQALSEKYKYSCVCIVAPETYKALDFIAAKKLKIILDPELVYLEKDPVTEEIKRIEIAKLYHDKGVEFAFQSDPEKVHARSLFYQGMKAMSVGFSAAEALKAVTLIPAELLGISNLVGSLDKGKLADLTVLDGEPFELRTKVEFVYIGGKEAYSREKDEELKKLMNDKIIK